ncbi:hypothetical protein KIW84_013106 [Lathyrus oleraceus]|uniref:Alpha/beta hydrolase fold-3 domain-containing protein n=1 Tax=Pisum sativum TaxID=3888 RepID=A0A9D5BJN6_PEA|nr:hypothetical protein KIW84_013106 [Pisum sativum]
MADDQHEEVSKKVSAEEEIRRGITVMRRVVQGRSRGIILDVYWNNQGQLIEPNGHTLTSFIGALVRNEIPITCDDWRNKELNESKEKIWSEIKRCFNIEEERRGFCMKLAGKLLRGFRTFLSSKFLKDADGNFVDAELPKKYESLISAEEWEAFKSKRQDPVFQRISAKNRERASSPAYPYRKGRVGYGRLEQSMLQKEESSETSLPAHVLWKEARVGKSGVPQEEVLHVYQKCEELSQSLSPDDTKGILSRALDVPEYYGRVRGKGFGVTPTSLSIKKGKAPSNRELHARLEAMQAELDALRREREASASTVYRDASDKDSINCTFQPNIPEGISHCQLYLSSPYYRMVGKGKVHNVSGVLLHTRELPAGCLKVSVDIAVEPNAALPYPSDDSDATTVHEAVGSFVAWPTNLICVGYELVAVVVSVEYRLAPEHRLPAAYEDAVEALHWIKTNQSDEWLKNHVDYSNVFLMGSSAGGNIAYNAGLRVAMVEDEVSKMIKGLILIQPFFSGIHRTRSEIKLANDSHLLLCNNDMLWELSLPIGVDRDHEYCNPTVRDNVLRLKRIRELEWWVLVTDCDGDPLVDRSIGLVRLMEKNGVNVVRDFTEGGYHGVQDSEPLKAIELFGVIKKFISSLPNHTIE